MRDTGIVTEFGKNGLVKIIPVIDGACLSCTVTGCAKRGKPFFVTNPKNIALSLGNHVKVTESKLHQIIQAVTNLFLPITLAFATYILLDTSVSEGQKAFLALTTFFISCLILFFISTKRKLVQSEIESVVE